MRLTHLTMLASLERSSKCAASTAETMAPSSADKSQVSSVTRNFLARLKNAAGPFDALTAITCLAGGRASCDEGCVLADGWSLWELEPRSSEGDAEAEAVAESSPGFAGEDASVDAREVRCLSGWSLCSDAGL
jgi:hypothetical protein